MNMKKFFLTNLLVLVCSAGAWACGGEGPSTHNWYMFSMYPHYGNTTPGEKQIEAFWRKYADDNDEYFYFNGQTMMEKAQQKGDTEMEEYLKLLNQFHEICGQLQNTWSYPTKEQLAQRRATLQNMVNVGKNNSSNRMRPQYMLLAMRANMLLGNYQANADYWEQKASKMPESVYRVMMKGIYANALLHTGKRHEAWDIYAEQGDVQSLRWSVRKFRNFDGIQSIYNENPNAPTLTYLVQDFVNDLQETIDCDMLNSNETELGEGTSLINIDQARRFIKLADEAARNITTQNPCLWKAASGLVHHLLGEEQLALSDVDEAMKMNGNDRMHDNARCIRLLIKAATYEKTKKYENEFFKEMSWLDQKIKQAGEDDCYYANVKDRVLRRELYKCFKKKGETYLSIALMANEGDNGRYSEFYEAIDTLPASNVVSVYNFLCSKPSSRIEQMAFDRVQKDDNFFYDFIGTKYLSEGRFKDAIPWLEKVPLKFIQGQNISWYMANRDYTRPCWVKSLRTGWENEEQTDGPDLGTIRTNKKLDFCREMVQLLAQYPLQNGEQKRQTAHQLAIRYYQASHWGDCWFLGRYGTSVDPFSNTCTDTELDFVAQAVNYLQVSKNSSDFATRQEALYALALLPIDYWIEYDWNSEVVKVNRDSRQYASLAELDAFARQNVGRVATFVSNCDVLRQFRKHR